MTRRSLVIALTVPFFAFLLYQIIEHNGEDTVSIIRNYGYNCQIHYITTEDGYILTYHRILPRNDAKKPPVLLMHGLGDSSATWVIVGPTRALGFLLADLGYDVWLGNHRGNAYSRNHTVLDPVQDNEKFYNFTFHEVGYYDLPAAVDYILNTTNEDSLHYVGLSLGTTVYLAFDSTRSEYRGKIRLASLMAPAAIFYYYPRWGIKGLLARNSELLYKMATLIRLYEVPFTEFYRKVVPPFCANPVISYLCLGVLAFTEGNINDAYFNWEYIPRITANNPSNCGIKTHVHLAQLITQGRFELFDYGPVGNMKIYGNNTPPEYNLTEILTPIAAYYSKDDEVVPFANEDLLISKLSNVANNYMVPSSGFKHGSFILSEEINELVYNELIEIMSNY